MAIPSNVVLSTFRLSPADFDRVAKDAQRLGERQTEYVRVALEMRFAQIETMLTKAPLAADGRRELGELHFKLSTSRFGLIPSSPRRQAESLGHSNAVVRSEAKQLGATLTKTELQVLHWAAAFFGEDQHRFVADALRDRFTNPGATKVKRTKAEELKQIVEETSLVVYRLERKTKGGADK